MEGFRRASHIYKCNSSHETILWLVVPVLLLMIKLKKDINYLRLRVIHLILNIIFSGVIVILACNSAITFRFTLWLLSVMNKNIKD